MDKLIVADSSPLIALLNIGRLELLEVLFSKVIVPPMVATEVERGEASDSLWFKLRQKGFIHIETVTNDKRLTILRLQLDAGESEAILLAEKLNYSLLIDERAGRKMAKMMGVNICGLVGVLYALRQSNHLSQTQIKTIVQQLESVNFRMSIALKNLLLENKRLS